MDLVELLEKFGVPITMCFAFGYFIWKQNRWIQEDLKKDLEEQSKRLEDIVIGLINAQKKHSLDIRGLNASYKSICTIIQKLSGNGLGRNQ